MKNSTVFHQLSLKDKVLKTEPGKTSFKFELQETTKDSKKKVYGPYKGCFVKDKIKVKMVGGFTKTKSNVNLYNITNNKSEKSNGNNANNITIIQSEKPNGNNANNITIIQNKLTIPNSIINIGHLQKHKERLLKKKQI